MASLKTPRWLKEANRLITSVTGLEGGDLNYDICLQFVTSTFNYHRFLETNEKEVDKSYQRLIEKMTIHSELGIATKLKRLVNAVSNSENRPRPKQTNEILSSILLLFLRLSGSLDAVRLAKSQSFHLPLDDTNFDWTKYLKEDSDNEEDDIADISQYVDELSDWSAEETDENLELLHVKIVPPKRDDSGIDISADVKSVTHSVGTNATTPSPMQTYPPPRVTFEVGTPHSEEVLAKEQIWLQKNIINAYWKGCPSRIKRGSCLASNLNAEWENYLRENGVLSANENGSELTERQVVREVLWMLQGNDDLYVFNYDLDSRSFFTAEDIRVSHLTPNALFFFLDKMCEHAKTMKILKTYVEQSICSFRNSCQTIEAYVSGLQKYLNQLRSKISKFEKIVIDQEETCSLNDVANRLGPLLDVLNEVYEVHKEGIESVQPDAANRVKSVCLLSALYEKLSSCDLLQEESPIFSMFLVTFQPYLTTIEKFIYKGTIEDPFDEFFLTRNHDVKIKDEDFWINAFSNHVSEKSGCANFLKSFVKDILVAGKSVEILTALGEQSYVELSDDGINFFEQFIHKLKEILQPTPNSYSSDESGNFEMSEISGSSQAFGANLDLKNYMKSLNLWDPYLIENFCQNTIPASKSESHLLSDTMENVWNMKTLLYKPLHLAIHDAIAPLISRNCETVSRHLIDTLKTNYHLISVFQSVRRFYFMEAGDVMFTFYSAIFKKIQMGEDWKNDFALTMLLRDAFSYNYPSDISNISIYFEEETTVKKMSPIIALSNLRLSYTVPWPVDTIFTKESFKKYNTIFCFLLQIKQAKYCLDQLKFCDLFDDQINPEDEQRMVISMLMEGKMMKECKMPKGQIIHVMHLFRMKLMHFVNCLHDYVMIRILQTTDVEIQSTLDSAKSIKEIMEVHEKYLDNIEKRCLCHSDLSILKESAIKVLNLALQFQSKWHSELSTLRFDDLQRMEKLFINCEQFLLNFLSRLVKQSSSFSHLESLVVYLSANKMPVLFDALIG